MCFYQIDFFLMRYSYLLEYLYEFKQKDMPLFSYKP